MKSQIKIPLVDVEKASVSFWYVKEGDVIEKGKPVVELVTEKTSFTFESPLSGKLLKIYAAEGDEIFNNQPVAEVETE